jgi:DNA-directed RNA polymerase subunit beta'
MRGLMANPSNKIIETPITSNFKEGLSVLEYFISTHGARKGLADTALKTADAGYLTRRLVDVAQDVIIIEDDCGTPNGIRVTAIEEGNEIKVPLSERIAGRVAVNDVYEPGTTTLLFKAGELITEEEAAKVDDYDISGITIRSALTCEAKFGMCAKCYGMDLARHMLVQQGTPAGIIAAQSIGEPGTQLTMRTFHIGGTASSEVTKPYYDAGADGYVKIHNVRTVQTEEGELALNKNGFITLHDKNDREIAKYSLVIGAVFFVKDGDKVKKGQRLVKWDPYSISIYTEKRGCVQYEDIIEGSTMKREKNEKTGKIETVILETRENLRPRIIVKDPNTNETLSYNYIPANAHIVVGDGEIVKAGALIAKTPRKASMTKDITGGLPRVEELFEARIPKEAADIAKIDGVIEFREGITGGKRKVIVKNETTGEELEHLIPLGKHLVVTSGENVRKGQQLTEGAVNPHDLLAICGIKELQSYLLDQIQEVYRCQGVEINDKHVEVILRQMLRKVEITDPGDTSFLYGESIEIGLFNQENHKVTSANPPGRPAKGSPVLQGVTKAGLSTASFISAASFQETTRVLTEAAATGRKDPLLGFKENIIMGHIVPSGTGFTQEHFNRGYEGSDELYVGRVKTNETLPAFLSVDDDDDTGISDVESIIQSVAGYVPESRESSNEEN